MDLATIAAKYKDWRKLQCAANTLRIDKKGYVALKAMLADTEEPVEAVEDITSAHIDRHMQWRAKNGVSPRTINMELAAGKRMLEWAVDREMLESNPLKKWKPLREHGATNRRAFTLKEIHVLLDQMPGHWRMMFQVYLCTGMRRAEVVGLLWSEVGESCINLGAERTKTRAGRVVYLGPRITSMLKELPRDSEYVFVNRGWRGHGGTGLPYTLGHPGIVMKQAASDAGWKDFSGVTPQTLRRSFATVAFDAGSPKEIIGQLLGHKGSLAEECYIQFKAKDLQKAAAKVEALVLGEEK